MRTPYPRETDQRGDVLYDRLAAMSNHSIATLTMAIGIAFAALGLLVGEASALVLGLVAALIAFPWRIRSRGRLLQLKGLSWSQVPISARLWMWLKWYESAPDNYPYWDAHVVGHLPPPPTGG